MVETCGKAKAMQISNDHKLSSHLASEVGIVEFCKSAAANLDVLERFQIGGILREFSDGAVQLVQNKARAEIL